MIQEVGIAAASSWLGRFATVWSTRTTEQDQRRSSRARRTATAGSAVPETGGADAEALECSESLARLWAPTRSSLPRFDDTVAAPIDAPERLGEIIRTAADALTRLPPVHQPGSLPAATASAPAAPARSRSHR